jgi:putative nucleotidyltransferase with HDIG domain
MRASWQRQFAEVNRELWLILSLLAISALLNRLIASHDMVLGFYTLPTLFSAYYYGRRHATLTAFASIFLVFLLTWFNPVLFSRAWTRESLDPQKWFDIGLWAGILVLTAYTMGTLYESNKRRLTELRETYHGVLLILRQFISKDKYTQNHSYRVSIYASKIAIQLGLDSERVEDVRAAALLHDIGKLDIPREILYKAAKLTREEFDEIQTHVEKGIDMLEPIGGSLRRVLPIILAHHDRYDGTGYHPTRGDEIPLEARIIAVADAYDAMTSDRPYRKAMPPYEAREIIVGCSGKEFDPKVVEGFLTAFRNQELEVPEMVV